MGHSWPDPIVATGFGHQFFLIKTSFFEYKNITKCPIGLPAVTPLAYLLSPRWTTCCHPVGRPAVTPLDDLLSPRWTTCC